LEGDVEGGKKKRGGRIVWETDFTQWTNWFGRERSSRKKRGGRISNTPLGDLKGKKGGKIGKKVRPVFVKNIGTAPGPYLGELQDQRGGEQCKALKPNNSHTSHGDCDKKGRMIGKASLSAMVGGGLNKMEGGFPPSTQSLDAKKGRRGNCIGNFCSSRRSSGGEKATGEWQH